MAERQYRIHPAVGIARVALERDGLAMTQFERDTDMQANERTDLQQGMIAMQSLAPPCSVIDSANSGVRHVSHGMSPQAQNTRIPGEFPPAHENAGMAGTRARR